MHWHIAIVLFLLALTACSKRGNEQYARVGNIECLAAGSVARVGVATDSRSDPYGPKYLPFPLEEARAKFPSYALEVEGVRYDFPVEIWPSENFDKDLLLESYRLRGRFEGARVVYNPSLKGFQVYDRLDPSRWDLLAQPPSPNAPDPVDVWRVRIANCHQPVGFKHSVCTLHVALQGHAVFFKITDANMNLRDGLRDLVQSKLRSACLGIAQ